MSAKPGTRPRTAGSQQDLLLLLYAQQRSIFSSVLLLWLTDFLPEILHHPFLPLRRLTLIHAHSHAHTECMYPRRPRHTASHSTPQVEQNFEAADLESAAFFRPATLVGNANTPPIAATMSKMVSWMLPLKYKEIHIEDLGAAVSGAGCWLAGWMDGWMDGTRMVSPPVGCFIFLWEEDGSWACFLFFVGLRPD